MKEIKLAGIFRHVERFTASGKDSADPRFVFLFILTSFVAINLSAFSIKMMLLVIASSTIYSIAMRNIRRVVSSIFVAVPFIIFFSVSSFIITSDHSSMVRSSLFIFSIISVSAVMLNLQQKKILATLEFFRLPPKISMSLLIAIRLLNVYARDFTNIIEIHAINERKRLELYRKIVKATISVMVLRAISISENLYLRRYEEHSFSGDLGKIGVKEIYFLISSLIVFLFFLFSS
jgi:hypothetical protein